MKGIEYFLKIIFCFKECFFGYFGYNCSEVCEYLIFGKKCVEQCFCEKYQCNFMYGCINGNQLFLMYGFEFEFVILILKKICYFNYYDIDNLIRN